MNGPDLRAEHAPAEMAAHQARMDAEAGVAGDLKANLHDREVMARHGGMPSPEAAVANGVTPSSGGA